MKIRGLNTAEFTEIVQRVSVEIYDRNVIVEENAHDVGGNGCQARIKVKDSHGTGSRRTTKGRRMSLACWHAYRDVIHAVIESFPDARIDTGMEKYHGMAEFLRRYPSTADQNIGSEFHPAYMPDLCGCPDSIAWPSWL
jgi:hypothetical protein